MALTGVALCQGGLESPSGEGGAWTFKFHFQGKKDCSMSLARLESVSHLQGWFFLVWGALKLPLRKPKDGKTPGSPGHEFCHTSNSRSICPEILQDLLPRAVGQKFQNPVKRHWNFCELASGPPRPRTIQSGS